LGKLKNLLADKDNLIKTLRSDLELAGKKYNESIKEKEDLKSKLQLEINIKNRTRKASLFIGNQNELLENNYNNFEIENQKEVKTSRNNNNYSQLNIQNNLFSNFKKSAENNKTLKKKNLNLMNSIKYKLNESDEDKDDIMNNTVNINNINQKNFSNFAIFNNNFTSRNTKVIYFRIFDTKFLLLFYLYNFILI
jgi:hypothetical protein